MPQSCMALGAVAYRTILNKNAGIDPVYVVLSVKRMGYLYGNQIYEVIMHGYILDISSLDYFILVYSSCLYGHSVL